MIEDVVIGGILLGGIYIIVAAGLSLIFGVMKIINIAHGEFLILSAYIGYWLYILFNVNPFISIVITSIALAGTGIILQKFFLNSLLKRGVDPPLLFTFGLSLVLQNAMTVVWTADVRGILFETGTFKVPVINAAVSLVRFEAFLAGIAAAIILRTFLMKTYIGKAIRATAQDWEAAYLMGINVERVNIISFAVGAAFAATAGIFIGITFAFEPTSGLHFYLLKAMAIIVLGGVGSLGGLVAGSFLVGLLESLGSFFIGSGFRDAIVYVIFLLALIVRPQGIVARVRTW
jgi:branched-chain amino acid transport system permease protein